jgi:hypothetical protein
LHSAPSISVIPLIVAHSTALVVFKRPEEHEALLPS